MKTKPLYVFLAVLILASLACQTETPSEKSFPTRAAVIQTSAPYYATPQNWKTVPQECVKSLIQVISLNKKGENIAASATLISSVSGQNTIGETGYMYTFLTANHFKEDASLKMGSRLEMRVNNAQEIGQSVIFSTTNAKQVLDDNGVPMDIALVSVFGASPAVSINNTGPTPISINNISSGMSIPLDISKFYHVLGYPEVSEDPLYTIVFVKYEDFTTYEYKTIVVETYSDEFGTTTRGNSGGAMCSNDGKVIGVVTHVVENYKETVVDPLPNNIQEQIGAFLTESSNTLQMLGFTKAP